MRLSGSARTFAVLVTMATLGTSMSGCGSFRQAVGIDKISPDEFRIVTKAPLVIPPDYTLRPPTPGAPRPVEQRPDGRASSAVFGTADANAGTTGFTTGEVALMEKTGAAGADPDIRRVVNSETTSLAMKSKSFTDEILFWQEKATPESIVDAQAESRRLQENAAQGLPPNEGEVPEVEKRDPALLEGLFRF